MPVVNSLHDIHMESAIRLLATYAGQASDLVGWLKRQRSTTIAIFAFSTWRGFISILTTRKSSMKTCLPGAGFRMSSSRVPSSIVPV